MSSGPVPPGRGVDGPSVRVLSGRYRLDEAIGHGGVGVVWRARDLQLERDVAVKQLQPGLARDPRASERFRREAMQAASLTHPSMVTIFDVGQDDGVPYLVMELVDGPPLSEILRSRGPLDPVDTAALGHRLASGLAVAHARGLVHRDVKPGNVLMASSGPPRLVDFGAVHVRGEDAAELTTPGTMLGTIGYVAPEQLDGHPVDPRADVYAVGLVLYECLTGSPAFGSGTIAELTRRRLAEDAPAPSTQRPDVPADLDAIVVAATHRDPGRRPDDGAALADLLAPLVPEEADARLAAVARGDAAATTAMAVPPADRPGPPDAADTSVLVGPDPTPGDATKHGGGATAPGPAADEPDAGGRRPPWGLLVPLVGLVALAVLVPLVGLGPLGAPDDGDPGSGDGGQQQRAGQPVPVADAQDYDQFPGGGGDEHPDEVALAHDGDPSTDWTTEGYESADLGGLKDGVGLWVRAADGAEPRRVEVELTIPGADVDVYALDAPPGPDPGGWGDPIGTDTDASGQLAHDVPDGTGNVILVVFRSLGPDDGGRFRGGIGEIRLLA